MTHSVILFGGHGKIALLTHPLLAERGWRVDAVIRNPDHAADVTAAGANPVVLDVESATQEELTGAIAGHDAVVWSAGAGGGNPARTRAVDRDAAIRSMDAAKAAGVARYVMVSYHGAGPDHGVPADNPFVHYADAKAAADEHLRASGLDHTILGPSGLTLEAPGGISLGGSSGNVARATVAAVIAETLANPATIGRTIEFNDGDVPVAEALAS